MQKFFVHVLVVTIKQTWMLAPCSRMSVAHSRRAVKKVFQRKELEKVTNKIALERDRPQIIYRLIMTDGKRFLEIIDNALIA